MRRLYFFKGGLCDACEEQEPAVQAFERKHIGSVMVLRLNPNLKAYELPFARGRGRSRDRTVRLTPSFALYENQTPLRQSEGRIFTLDELETFVFDDEAQQPTDAPQPGAA